jgi:hypothetical protein
MRLYATDIPANSRQVRFLPGDGPEYDRMIVVTEEDGGETLFLQGWIGQPLSAAEWRQAKAELYPRATRVRFERWCPRRQSFREAVLPIT